MTLITSGLIVNYIDKDVVSVYRGATPQDCFHILTATTLTSSINCNVHELNAHIFNGLSTELPTRYNNLNYPQPDYIDYVSEGSTLVHDRQMKRVSETTQRIRYKKARLKEFNKGKGLLLRRSSI